MENKKFKNFIWDFDGTYMDTYPQILKCYEQIILDYGMSIDMKKIYDILIHKASKQAIEYINQETNIPEVEFRKKYKDYSKKDEYLDYIKPNEGTIELSKIISESGCRNFVATDRDETTIKLINKYGAMKYFTDIAYIGSYGIINPKPAPDLFEYLINKYNIKSDETLVLGDRELDVIMAHKFGMKACIFNPRFEYNEKADYVIDNFMQVEKFIDKIEKI